MSATIAYDRLVLAAGSDSFTPPIPGLAEFAFAATQLTEAVAPDRHWHALAQKPASKARNTVVVGGAGFTGLEVLGENADIRVIIVDRSEHVAPAMGTDPSSRSGYARWAWRPG